MKQESRDVSPFAALTFSQQQDKWREWRSQQLEFKKAADEQPLPKENEAKEVPQEKQEAAQAAPAWPMPTRHRELDKVLSRHQAAVKKAGAFQLTKGNDPPGR
ncbi:MAG: hypothetical protein IJB69_09630 [Clostridia bacterium]|nr:hypothetical protein [Clostridia bacterium]